VGSRETEDVTEVMDEEEPGLYVVLIGDAVDG
jgi:hypothetical protein